MYYVHLWMKVIPIKFVRSHEEKLPERVLLKTPGGTAWAVDVERKKGEVSLQNGWAQFAKFYSLSFGYFIVFDYMGHCNFQVRVYDTSTTEINYSNLNDEKSVLQIRKLPTGIDDSSSCELIMPCKKTRASYASQEAFHDGPKLKQEQGNSPLSQVLIFVFAQFLLHPLLTIQKFKSHVWHFSAIRNGGSASEEEKARALASANAFKSNKPFFVVSMKPSDVVGRSMVRYTTYVHI